MIYTSTISLRQQIEIVQFGPHWNQLNTVKKHNRHVCSANIFILQCTHDFIIIIIPAVRIQAVPVPRLVEFHSYEYGEPEGC